MENRSDIYKKYFANQNTGDEITINEVRDKEFRNNVLSGEEAQALLNFDRYRLSELSKIKSDLEFNARYCQLQILANIADYKEFLKEEYFFSELL